MVPRGPVSNRTDRSFMPGASPNGKLARQMSLGAIERLTVLQSIEILAGVRKLRGPLRGDDAPPGILLFVLLRRQDEKANWPGRQAFEDLGLQAVFGVNVAHQLECLHDRSL